MKKLPYVDNDRPPSTVRPSGWKAFFKDRSRTAKVTILLGCIAFAAFPAIVTSFMDTSRVSKTTHSPSGKFTVSVVHYGWSTGLIMAKSGIHPFDFGRDEVYVSADEDGWFTRLTWRDNNTLVVRFQFHQPPNPLPRLQWHDINIIFEQDTPADGPL